MKTLKKIFALLLTLLTVLSLTACSEDTEALVNEMVSAALASSGEETEAAEPASYVDAEAGATEEVEASYVDAETGATEEAEASYVDAESGATEEAAAAEDDSCLETVEVTDDEAPEAEADDAGEALLDEHGSYDSKEDVALFIEQYGHLPDNYITKKEAQALGWSGGSLEPYAPGKCIGGTYFGNYEGILPTRSGRSYTECDIDTLGASSRGAKRIVFSNDGLIYYTEDHYETFELLYGDDSQ